MNTNLNTKTLEALLKKGVQGGNLDFVLTDEDIDFLLAHSEAVPSSRDIVPDLELIILNAIKERENFEIAELRKSATFGEYFVKLKEKVNKLLGFGSIKDFLPASISLEKLKHLERDQIRKLTPADISEVIIRFAIPLKEALRLLENSFKLEDLKEKQLFSSSNARVHEKPNTESRIKTTTSSMQKLLLAVDSDKHLTDIEKEWKRFRAELERQLAESGYIDGEPKHG